MSRAKKLIREYLAGVKPGKRLAARAAALLPRTKNKKHDRRPKLSFWSLGIKS